MSSAGHPPKTRRRRFVDYQVYIRSSRWRIKQQAALRRAQYACQLCKNKKRLQVHHNTYERLGDEIPSDLVVLCDRCHGFFHDELGLFRVPQ